MAQHLSQRESNHARKHYRVAIVAVTVIIAIVAAGIISGRHWAAQWNGMEIQPAIVPEQQQITATYEHSPVDYNGNGKDDYTDIIAGARKDAEAKPRYDAGYYQGGYPPADRGACTDLVWRAFREAGYDLKAMIDADIAADPASYASVAPEADPNIDFRRVGVQQVFFAKYAQTLPTDINDITSWQAGDIVVFGNAKHIGVISDRRDAGGLPYVMHNMGQQQRENDYLAFKTHMPVTGHYRFDASKVPQQVLKAWQQ